MNKFFHWIGLSSLALAAALGPVAAQPQDDRAPSAESILEGHVEALGGRAALAEIKTRVSRGSMLVKSMDSYNVLTLWESASQDRLQHAQSEILGNQYEGSRKGIAWTSSLMAGSRILKGQDRARALREAPLGAAAAWRIDFQQVEYLGTQTVEKIDCHVVRLIPKEGEPERRFYGSASRLHVRTEALLSIEGSRVPAVLTYGDYRPVDGVLVPFQRGQKFGDIDESILRLESVVHNVELPKELFTPPAEIRGLEQKK